VMTNKNTAAMFLFGFSIEDIPVISYLLSIAVAQEISVRNDAAELTQYKCNPGEK